jgi:hypothetical protein
MTERRAARRRAIASSVPITSPSRSRIARPATAHETLDWATLPRSPSPTLDAPLSRATEGDLSKMRASQNAEELAQRMDSGAGSRSGRAGDAAGARRRRSSRPHARAVLGAVYPTRVGSRRRVVGPAPGSHAAQAPGRDYKTRLRAHAASREMPVLHALEGAGHDHKEFSSSGRRRPRAQPRRRPQQKLAEQTAAMGARAFERHQASDG